MPTVTYTPTPNFGTAFSDGIRIGEFQTSGYNFGKLGLSYSPFMVYAIIPDPSAIIYNGNLPNGQLTLGTAPAGSAYVTYQGYTNVLQLDCNRGLYISVPVSVTAAPILTVSGWDFWGQKLVSQLTVPSGIQTYVAIPKSFSYINSIYSSTTTGNAVVIHTDNRFGFPFFVSSGEFVINSWNGAPDYSVTPSGAGRVYLNSQTGSGNQINPRFVPGDPTNPATATTGDVRGTYSPSNLLPADGFTWAVMRIYAQGFDPMAGSLLAPNIGAPSQLNTYGVTQFSAGWQ